MKRISFFGSVLAGAYILLCAILIAQQGLFGESFIALILGMPLSMVFASFEFGNASGAMLYVLILLPIAFNVFLLYWIGAGIGKALKMASKS